MIYSKEGVILDNYEGHVIKQDCSYLTYLQTFVELCLDLHLVKLNGHSFMPTFTPSDLYDGMKICS